jgi:sugar phosphate isomerase/epimerase
MKLGISNLAWNTNCEFKDLVPILKENNIQYIELVFPKHLEWNKINYDHINEFLEITKKNKLKVLSTQSIFFNSNINSFYDVDFLNHLKIVCYLSEEIGVNKLVLGSPNMRIDKNYNKLSEIFQEVDKLMFEKNIILLLEPNSKIYNGEFFNTVREIVGFIKTNNFTNIKTMIDTHNIILENEDPVIIFNQYKDYIKHIHVSEIGLGSFIESDNHNELSETLYTSGYRDLIIYEAKTTNQIEKDIELFSKIYNK